MLRYIASRCAPTPSGLRTRDDRRDHSDAGVDVSDHSLQIVRLDPHVAVADEDPVVASTLVGAHHVVDLGIRSDVDCADAQKRADFGIFAHQLANDRDRGIARVGDAETELIRRDNRV